MATCCCLLKPRGILSAVVVVSGRQFPDVQFENVVRIWVENCTEVQEQSRNFDMKLNLDLLRDAPVCKALEWELLGVSGPFHMPLTVIAYRIEVTCSAQWKRGIRVCVAEEDWAGWLIWFDPFPSCSFSHQTWRAAGPGGSVCSHVDQTAKEPQPSTRHRHWQLSYQPKLISTHHTSSDSLGYYLSCQIRLFLGSSFHGSSKQWKAQKLVPQQKQEGLWSDVLLVKLRWLCYWHCFGKNILDDPKLAVSKVAVSISSLRVSVRKTDGQCCQSCVMLAIKASETTVWCFCLQLIRKTVLQHMELYSEWIKLTPEKTEEIKFFNTGPKKSVISSLE